MKRKIFFNGVMPERLRTLRHCIFTGGVLETNSLSQSLTALTAPSEREPLAYPQTLCPNRKLYRHAKGPILEDDFPRSGGRCRAATKRGICRRRRLGEYPQMPSRENEIAERPQTLRYLEIKNNFSADHAQSARGGHSKSSRPPTTAAARGCRAAYGQGSFG